MEGATNGTTQLYRVSTHSFTAKGDGCCFSHSWLSCPLSFERAAGSVTYNVSSVTVLDLLQKTTSERTRQIKQQEQKHIPLASPPLEAGRMLAMGEIEAQNRTYIGLGLRSNIDESSRIYGSAQTETTYRSSKPQIFQVSRSQTSTSDTLAKSFRLEPIVVEEMSLHSHKVRSASHQPSFDSVEVTIGIIAIVVALGGIIQAAYIARWMIERAERRRNLQLYSPVELEDQPIRNSYTPSSTDLEMGPDATHITHTRRSSSASLDADPDSYGIGCQPSLSSADLPINIESSTITSDFHIPNSDLTVTTLNSPVITT